MLLFNLAYNGITRKTELHTFVVQDGSYVTIGTDETAFKTQDSNLKTKEYNIPVTDYNKAVARVKYT